MLNIKYTQFIHFFKNVCLFLNIHDWKIEFNYDNYCWIHKKIITINPEYDGDVRQIILHEIAHINTCRFSNQKHTPAFWKHLEYITWKFLKKEIDNHQIRHRTYMTNGIYKLCYENEYIRKN